MSLNKHKCGRRLTGTELEFIKFNWDKMPIIHLATELNCSPATIHRVAKRNKFPKLINFKRGWVLNPITTQEDRIILHNLLNFSKKEIAIMINRHPTSIYRHIAKKHPNIKGLFSVPGYNQYPPLLRPLAKAIYNLNKNYNHEP